MYKVTVKDDHCHYYFNAKELFLVALNEKGIANVVVDAGAELLEHANTEVLNSMMAFDSDDE